MSFEWIKTPVERPGRGGAPVGLLAELPGLECAAILLLRQWCDSDGRRNDLASDFEAICGPGEAPALMGQLSHLIRLLIEHGRRPLMRHDLTCACFGGDESCFAQMVAAATADDRDDAMAFALILMPPDAAYEAVQTAAPLGRALAALVLRLRRIAQTRTAKPTQH